ncbi:hypothetical protein PENSUB_3854 [Penicillium subrubescens]|jgi:hypothetical protein|uniref:Uncharacterized protein n=1 Tax=Penicillium subrubescens TaxID=1316194 RepID=A0A1Q5UDK6_9EURO|nr:hypothetical protein PENSUB_3854 [Penicillium subrubescens]
MTRINAGIRKYRIVCFVQLGSMGGWEQGSPGFGPVGQWAINANHWDQAGINMYAKVKLAGFSHI